MTKLQELKALLSDADDDNGLEAGYTLALMKAVINRQIDSANKVRLKMFDGEFTEVDGLYISVTDLKNKIGVL